MSFKKPTDTVPGYTDDWKKARNPQNTERKEGGTKRPAAKPKAKKKK